MKIYPTAKANPARNDPPPDTCRYPAALGVLAGPLAVADGIPFTVCVPPAAPVQVLPKGQQPLLSHLYPKSQYVADPLQKLVSICALGVGTGMTNSLQHIPSRGIHPSSQSVPPWLAHE